MQTTATPRRTDLDWLRIGAFGLLILYHLGMFYSTWGWHVKSPRQSAALDLVMLLTNPWRLDLLFLISGAATRFMTDRLAPGALARSRSLRLLVPLLFGMLVIVPPQAYYEVVEKLGYADGFLAFYGRYVAADQGFCEGGKCLILPTWNHLWFVAYLWVYTMLLAALLRAAPRLVERAERGLSRLLSGAGLFVVPIAALAGARIALMPLFGSTHALVDDWYNHAVHLPVFALGFLVARSEAFWSSVERARWLALVLALCAYATIAAAYAAYGTTRPTQDEVRLVLRLVYGVDQWCWILALLGFGRRWLSGADGPARRYLTEAIFPFYIIHQTAIVVVAVHLEAYALPVAVEAAIILGATAAVCVAGYEVARRIGILRPLFGLRPISAATAEIAITLSRAAEGTHRR